MASIAVEKIPTELTARKQWVVWRYVVKAAGTDPTKVPFQPNGAPAKADDTSTWSTIDDVLCAHARGGYDGIGYEFSADDPYCGVDLDACRDPETGKVQEWARKVVVAMQSYAEVSPSQTGIKIFIRGKSPFEKGRQCKVSADKIGTKEPKIEVYDWGRYFAVTGQRLAGMPDTPQERQPQLERICKQFFVAPGPVKEADVADRARRYMAKVPGAVSGQGGHNTTFRAACILVLGFGLKKHEAFQILAEWNATCQPPWSERDLWHKVSDADTQQGERNYLRFVAEEKWESTIVPTYTQPRSDPKVTTLFEATELYLERLRSGKIDLIELGMGSVDHALGGGVEKGELVILAARPSHGKSAVALNIIHNWTKQKRPCAMVSEEMSAVALGKRSLQFATEVPQEYWFKSGRELERDIVDHFSERATCYVVESCRTSLAAADAVRKMVKEHEVQCAVIDYAQLLTGQGKSRYEQVTNTSIVMRQLASELNIVVLLLCQLNSEVEKRPKFNPLLSDIKDSGQFGQDADVIMFLCWPHRLNDKCDPNEYQFFFKKNRNRGISSPVIQCKFLPSRQMFVERTARDCKSFEPDFDTFNERKDFA